VQITREELQFFIKNPPEEASQDLRFDPERLLAHFDELASARSARKKATPVVPVPEQGVTLAGYNVASGVNPDDGGVTVAAAPGEPEEWHMALNREDFIRGVMLMRKEQFDQRQIGQVET
jgi:hypothetical protein